MKKVISLILTVLTVVFLFAACEKNEKTNTSSSGSAVTNTTEDSSAEAGTESEQGESSQVPIVSNPESTQNAESPKPNPLALTNVTVGPYEIYDALNSRGLSTKKSGFGYGVASGGRPHSISVNNQLRFDGMENANALALDTKCIDKRMYLTFDCGWEYKNLTADILDTLKEKQVKAAFFLTLDYVKKNPELTKRMIDEGHIVGNHSAHHPSFPTISREKMAKEIWELEDYINKNFNYKSNYFRFPSGEHSECSLELVSSMGYSSIFWSVAYSDWDVNKQPTKEDAVKTVTNRYHNGAIILLHAVSQANADGLSEMIDIALNEGYEFKSLDEYAE